MYANSLNAAFVFDDFPAIVENPHVRNLRPFSESLGAPEESPIAGRPVAAFSFAVSYALAGGYDTQMYHAMNIAIHACAALALFGILRRTLLTPPLRRRFGASSTTLAFVIALLWAVHPVQTQSVTYIVQRVESLMGLFLLLTLYCAIRSREGGSRAAMWMTASVICCALGMGTKQVMVGAPILVVLWDWLFAGGPDASGRPVWRWRFYAALSTTWLLLAYLVATETRPHSVGSILGWTPLSYLVTQAGVILHYLRLSAMPFPLIFDYDWPAAHGFVDAWLPVAIVSVLVAGTLFGVLRRHPASFAGGWFFVILAPSSSVLPVVTEIVAVHRMYLPLAAVLALAVLSAHVLVSRASRQWLVPAAALALAFVFAAQTAARNRDYESDERIWMDTIAKQPSNARAHHNYAVDLTRVGRMEAAEIQARAALAAKPDMAEAHQLLGVILGTTGRPDEGIAELRRASELDPADPGTYRNLGEAYGAKGEFALAAHAFLQAIRYQPDDPFLLNRAGWLLATAPDARVRDGARALSLARHAVELTRRQDSVSLDTLAAAHAEVGEFDAAVIAAREALAVARATQETAIVPELEQRRALYESRQPFRTPAR